MQFLIFRVKKKKKISQYLKSSFSSNIRLPDITDSQDVTLEAKEETEPLFTSIVPVLALFFSEEETSHGLLSQLST